ncbi:MAG: hypothetical protein Q8L41_13510 [Anaerolineales bacterium]|nr:hypothetical protein [Anaerolineales bacterium]
MNAIKITDTNGFVDELLGEYLKNGMGALSKREVDILIMYLLGKYGDLVTLSNHELSIRLQMTETHVKNLRYEAHLKYPPVEEKYVEIQFLLVLARSVFDAEKEKINFVLEDEYLRHAIQGRLKARGMFADSSFNTEIIKIDHTALEKLIREMYGKKVADQFQKGFSRLLKKEAGMDFQSLLKTFVKSAVNSLGSAVGPLAIAQLKLLVPEVFPS